ncbi:hypothetical protein RRG08_008177 [Elysia crispata]|uniref:Uncharacterized protein n=1 Tax=Elysia crispata TaxID=231223 RepID=A0AAE0Y0C1_9GAST|nr:hypothetical protein RRG08_008177 [Elysia crispata]
MRLHKVFIAEFRHLVEQCVLEAELEGRLCENFARGSTALKCKGNYCQKRLKIEGAVEIAATMIKQHRQQKSSEVQAENSRHRRGAISDDRGLPPFFKSVPLQVSQKYYRAYWAIGRVPGECVTLTQVLYICREKGLVFKTRDVCNSPGRSEELPGLLPLQQAPAPSQEEKLEGKLGKLQLQKRCIPAEIFFKAGKLLILKLINKSLRRNNLPHSYSPCSNRGKNVCFFDGIGALHRFLRSAMCLGSRSLTSDSIISFIS